MFEDGWAAAPLRWVMDTVGHTHLDRMAVEPGLVAAVDQHAAALRDAIPLDRETLGDYLLGFADELRHLGWTPGGEDDLATVRLTAICWLARELGLLTDESPA
ncbi:DUF6401 family natural product biosynthesis protein [Nonomuraea cavernae]|uniref:Uncharacterized protein n=1 Tax=Nonomuraea cavernae TaxID=2045107 RepID=A0A917YRK9_9ACTN|nr:DUF6401 family natural product biosynthesis protein [Nonomuraea cavernae]MCA2184381.1 DUF6401 family natural product biosynthesis protein [Nonomuraea cavernae]GGO63963.1 hypothetical protein GCM10012289_12280 [Nonomuraea cavernae]